MNEKPTNTLHDLDWDIQPERDLWADIDSNIRFSGKPNRDFDTQLTDTSHTQTQHHNKPRRPWVPVAIAACSVMAVVSVVMSGMSLQRANQTYELQAQMVEYQKSHIALMEQQHKVVRAQFVSFIENQTMPLNADAAEQLLATLATFDAASTQLKEALIAQPTNTRYATTLADTYQQEAELLNKIKAQATRSI